MKRSIEELKLAGRPTGPLEASLWHKLSGPVSAVLMPLLSGVAAFGLARSGQLFLRAIIGMALGFAYFVVDNFALAMGNFGAYPPLFEDNYVLTGYESSNFGPAVTVSLGKEWWVHEDWGIGMAGVYEFLSVNGEDLGKYTVDAVHNVTARLSATFN